LSFGGWLLEARTLLVWSSLEVAAIGALVTLLVLDSPLRAQVVSDRATRDEPQVPGAERRDADCVADLTTRTHRTRHP
jgi:hypothetical protein